MLKWRLMLTTLPYVAAVVALKLVLDLVLNFHGILDFTEVSMVLTGGVFLIGFMLAGTMADYKESERLPGEIACVLETIEETIAQASVSKPALSGVALRRAVVTMADRIVDWLYKRIDPPLLFAALSELHGSAVALERAGAGPYAGRALNELHALRKALTRVGVISRTGFLPSGYALLETLAAATLGLLLVARFHGAVAEGILVAFVTLIFVYMIRLIRDIDDPFDYVEGRGGTAEVELFPILEYRDRASARLEAAARATEASS
jgi:hypothetical protein